MGTSCVPCPQLYRHGRRIPRKICIYILCSTSANDNKSKLTVRYEIVITIIHCKYVDTHAYITRALKHDRGVSHLEPDVFVRCHFSTFHTVQGDVDGDCGIGCVCIRTASTPKGSARATLSCRLRRGFTTTNRCCRPSHSTCRRRRRRRPTSARMVPAPALFRTAELDVPNRYAARRVRGLWRRATWPPPRRGRDKTRSRATYTTQVSEVSSAGGAHSTG